MSTYPGIETTTRAELGSFLRSRRARISPATVGLHGRARRRTPGLRREEVADLAGVSPTWYTWLEQGREIRVSPEVLRGVARALQLEPAERAHLFRLAGHAPPAPASADSVSPRLRRVLDHWEPFPAHVVGRRRDVLAWNRASEAVNRWSRLPEDRRNVLWFMLMPSTRRLLLDWEREAALSVAAFRADAGSDLAEPDHQALVGELLRASPDFAGIWARQDVRGRLEGLKHLQHPEHPELGRFDLEFTSFQVAEQPSLRLYLYAPPDDRSETVLRAVVAAASAAPTSPVANGAAAPATEERDSPSRGSSTRTRRSTPS